MYLSHLFRALSLELDEPLSVECDNRQTIRLLVEVAKLQTKLRHVDIHSHKHLRVFPQALAKNEERYLALSDHTDIQYWHQQLRQFIHTIQVLVGPNQHLITWSDWKTLCQLSPNYQQPLTRGRLYVACNRCGKLGRYGGAVRLGSS
jgi:hypothetical protein